MLTGGEVCGSVTSVLCMAQGRTQPGHTAGEHLGLYSSGHMVGGYLSLCPLSMCPLGCERHSGLQWADPSVQSSHRQQLIPTEYALTCPMYKQTGPQCPAGGTVCATRDLWLAKRLLNKGKSLVQISVAAPEK